MCQCKYLTSLYGSSRVIMKFKPKWIFSCQVVDVSLSVWLQNVNQSEICIWVSKKLTIKYYSIKKKLLAIEWMIVIFEAYKKSNCFIFQVIIDKVFLIALKQII